MTREELRQWRLQHQVSPGALAAGLNANRNTIYRYESGDLELPSDLENRLATFLLSRDQQAAEDAERPLHTSEDNSAVIAPHGEVIGLQQHFWKQWTDARRVAWIMGEANDPLRALPWPWWSHGWSHWPISPDHYDKAPGPAGTPRPHYLAKWATRVLRQHMSQDEALPLSARLRQAVIDLCRRDNPAWMMHGRRVEIDDDLHAFMQSVTDGAK